MVLKRNLPLRPVRMMDGMPRNMLQRGNVLSRILRGFRGFWRSCAKSSTRYHVGDDIFGFSTSRSISVHAQKGLLRSKFGELDSFLSEVCVGNEKIMILRQVSRKYGFEMKSPSATG